MAPTTRQAGIRDVLEKLRRRRTTPERAALPRTDSGREIPPEGWDARGWVSYDPGDPVEFSSADDSGNVSAVMDTLYRPLQPGEVVIHDGSTGTVTAVGEDVVFIRVDDAQWDKPYAFRRADVVNLKLEDERRWSERTAEEYWGRAGAGVLFTCSEDGTVLLLLRSSNVEDPETWGIAGGDAEEDEDAPALSVHALQEAARREVEEEMGGWPGGRVVDTTVYEDGSFRYVTFIVDLSLEEKAKFEPTLNWENTDWGWFPLDDLPDPVHFGVAYTFANSDALKHEDYYPALREKQSSKYTPDDFLPVVQEVLAERPDLLKKKYRELHEQGQCDPMTGHCYVAAETLYHLLGGKAQGYKPMYVCHEEEPHWYLLSPDGSVVDATSSQFQTPVPYDQGRGKGFLTSVPSERAYQVQREVRRRMRQKRRQAFDDVPESTWREHVAVHAATRPIPDDFTQRYQQFRAEGETWDRAIDRAMQTEAYLREKDEPGESAVVVVRIPDELAEMFPESRAEEDDSPAHLTVLYIGPFDPERTDELLALVDGVAERYGPFALTFSEGVEWFENDEGQQIAYKGADPTSAALLRSLHEDLRDALEEADFEVQHHTDYGFIPHATLAYLDERVYEDPVPEGSFPVAELEVWGLSEDDLIVPLVAS